MSSILGGFAGVGGSSIGRAAVDLVLNTGAYNAELASAEAKTASSTASMGKGFAGFQQSVRSSFSGAQVAIVGFGAVAAIAISKGIKATQDWAAGVRTLQRVTGDTAESTSALAGAGALLNLDVAKLNTGFGVFAKNVTTGNKALDEYGVKTKDANGNTLGFNEILANASDQFQTLQPGIEQTGFAMRLFGRSGKEMIPILQKGSEGMQELYDRAEAAGLVMSQGTLDASKELSVAQRELGLAVKGASIQIGSAFLPVLEGITTALTTVVELIQKVPQPLIALVFGLTTAAAAIIVMNKAWVAMKLVMTQNMELLTGTLPLLAAIAAAVIVVAGQIGDASINFEELSKQTKISADLLEFWANRMNLAGAVFENPTFEGFIASLDGSSDSLDTLTQKLSPSVSKLRELGISSSGVTDVLGKQTDILAANGYAMDGSADRIGRLVDVTDEAVSAIDREAGRFASGKTDVEGFSHAIEQYGVSHQDAMRIANAALDDYGKHLDKAGHKVNNFAGMTKDELSDFSTSTDDSMNFVESAFGDLGNQAHLTGRQILRSFQQALHAQANFTHNSVNFLKQVQKELGPGLQQAAQDMVAELATAGPEGAARIEALARANDTQQRKIVAAWKKSGDSAKSYSDKVLDVQGSLQNLDGTSIDVTINTHVNGTGVTKESSAAFANWMASQMDKGGRD